MVREREEAGGVSVQFTNTTVNSEAGQDTERAGGGVRKRLTVSRMPLKCSTHASVQKYKLFTVHLHDVRVHARVLLNSYVHCLLPGAPERDARPIGA